MKTYKVTITEKLEMEVEVEAPGKYVAIELIEKQWKDGDLILDADHFKGVDFCIKPQQREHER